jgi:transcriptional regulator with XRE-family HTH domain
MPSAQHREAVRDFSTANKDTRMDIGGQVAERREALGLTSTQLAEDAQITEMSLHMLERGGGFDGGHTVACAVLKALARLESANEGRPDFQLARIRFMRN